MSSAAFADPRRKEHSDGSGWGRHIGPWQPCREGQETGHYNAAACDVDECRRLECVCMWHKHGSLAPDDAVSQEMELLTKPNHFCLRCGCGLDDSLSDYCRPCRDERREEWKRKQLYRKGLVCSVCGSPIQDANKTLLCRSHASQKAGRERLGARALAPEIVWRIYELRDEGLTQRAVAARLGINCTTVCRYEKRRFDK